ncbi:MAG: YbaK/EbsC family protein [Planctomycetia bacterium]|nr:YbaK/EbsC family protein [Planctomycetia bacterium]
MKEKHPMTQAIRVLQKSGVPFELMTYAYEERGGTRVSARELGVEEHAVIKTLIMRTEEKPSLPLVVLMHGDREVSTKELARIMRVKGVVPCAPQEADKYSGYHVGGTSPFGTRRKMEVYAESTIRDLSEIYINAGSRGLLAKMNPLDLEKLLPIHWVAISRCD